MRALPALLVLASCASSFPKIDLATAPKPNDFPDAKYVVLLDEDHVRFQPGKNGKAEAIITERWRAKVLKPTELPPLLAFYDSEFTEIVSIAGRTISPEGVEKPLDVSKADDVPTNSSSVLFSNTRVRAVRAPSVPVGGIFETEIVSRQRDIEPWVLRHVFGGAHPVVASRVVVEVPTGWDVRWTGLGPTGPVTITPARAPLAGFGDRITFERANIPTPIEEPGAPPALLRLERLSLRLEQWSENGTARAAQASPEALSRWIAPRYRERAELTPEIEATARSLVKDAGDNPTEKARVLYEYACRSIQYCAIEVGYGGWIPHAAKDVHAQRYGDCKDKATYLHALLKAVGIDSSPTLIYSHDGWPRPFELPSLGANFNHAILAVHLPQGTVYVDPTERAVPFGTLPWNDAEATVLEVRDDGQPLRQTPASSPDDNTETQRFELTLDEAGHAAGRFSITSRGNQARPIKMRALTGTGRLERWASDRLWLDNAEVTRVALDRVEDFGSETVVSGELKTRRVVSRGLGTAGLLRLTTVLDRAHTPLEDGRSAPWASAFRWTRETQLVLRLPAGVKPSTLPQDVTVSSPFGQYSLTWRLEAGVLTATRRLRLDQRVIEPKDAAAAGTFHERLSLAELTPVVLHFEGGAR
jgi:transglutaminase-like putative cysteine protease